MYAVSQMDWWEEFKSFIEVFQLQVWSMCYIFNDFVYYMCVYIYVNKVLETWNLFPVVSSGQAQVLLRCSYAD